VGRMKSVWRKITLNFVFLPDGTHRVYGLAADSEELRLDRWNSQNGDLQQFDFLLSLARFDPNTT
jgi:hypothetical protein